MEEKFSSPLSCQKAKKRNPQFCIFEDSYSICSLDNSHRVGKSICTAVKTIKCPRFILNHKSAISYINTKFYWITGKSLTIPRWIWMGFMQPTPHWVQSFVLHTWEAQPRPLSLDLPEAIVQPGSCKSVQMLAQVTGCPWLAVFLIFNPSYFSFQNLVSASCSGHTIWKRSTSIFHQRCP